MEEQEAQQAKELLEKESSLLKAKKESDLALNEEVHMIYAVCVFALIPILDLLSEDALATKRQAVERDGGRAGIHD